MPPGPSRGIPGRVWGASGASPGLSGTLWGSPGAARAPPWGLPRACLGRPPGRTPGSHENATKTYDFWLIFAKKGRIGRGFAFWPKNGVPGLLGCLWGLLSGSCVVWRHFGAPGCHLEAFRWATGNSSGLQITGGEPPAVVRNPLLAGVAVCKWLPGGSPWSFAARYWLQ